MMKTLNIGTRGSKLALWQAEQVKDLLLKAMPDLNIEIVVIKTKGDKILNQPLSLIGDKGLFTQEIESALINRDIDLAVHSLKDLPTVLPEGLALTGVLQRGEVRDVLLSNDNLKLEDLTSKHKIGTSSLRRRAQLKKFNPSLNVVDIRGNVDTRIKKMESGEYDAIVLAGAGVIRLGYENKISEYLAVETIIPAASQGIVAIESRENDTETSSIIEQINHPETWQIALAERSFLNTLEGGCHVPMGCHTSTENNLFTIEGFVSDSEGKTTIQQGLKGNIEHAENVAEQLARLILGNGGYQLIKEPDIH